MFETLSLPLQVTPALSLSRPQRDPPTASGCVSLCLSLFPRVSFCLSVDTVVVVVVCLCVHVFSRVCVCKYISLYLCVLGLSLSLYAPAEYVCVCLCACLSVWMKLCQCQTLSYATGLSGNTGLFSN